MSSASPSGVERPSVLCALPRIGRRVLGAALLAAWALLPAACRTSAPPAATPASGQEEDATAAEASDSPSRPPAPLALLDLDLLMGWTVRAGAEVDPRPVQRSEATPGWRGHSLHVTWTNLSPAAPLLIEPPEAIRLPQQFDLLSIWALADLKSPAPVEVAFRILDRQGTVHEVDVGQATRLGWRLLRRTLSREVIDPALHPCRLAGIVVRPGAPAGGLTLDALDVRVERVRPLAAPTRPRRGIELPAAQDPGVNRGPGRLRFPDDPATILPVRKGTWRSRIEQDARGWVHFIAESDEHRLQFILKSFRQPGQLEVMADGRRIAEWRAEPLLEGLPAAPPQRLDLADEYLELYYAGGTRVRYSLVRGALSLEVQGHEPVREVNAGRWLFDPGAALWPLDAYASDPSRAPSLAVVQAGGRAWFLTQWFDWTRSNASLVKWASGREADGIRLTGRAVYKPTTRGRRNPVVERMVFLLSPELLDVIPRIPHPPSDHLGSLRSLIPAAAGGGDASRFEWGTLYGQTNIVALPAAPRDGGCAGGAPRPPHETGGRGIRMIQTRLCCPQSPAFSGDQVQRQPDGTWRPAGPLGYARKPLSLFSAPFHDPAETIGDSEIQLLAGMAETAPWDNTDYDARLPGAATYAQSYYAYGDWVSGLSAVSPRGVMVQGRFGWLMAGLADGWVLGAPGRAPINLLIGHHRISPLMAVFPDPGSYGNHAHPAARILADAMARGWGPVLPGIDTLEESERLRLVALAASRLDARPSPPPAAIEFRAGDRYVPYADIMGRSLANPGRRLRLQYGGGRTVFINLGREAWTLPGEEGGEVLPPDGWKVMGPGGNVRMLLARDEAGRYAYARTTGGVFADGYGRERAVGPLVTTDGLWIEMPKGDAGGRIQWSGRPERFALDLELADSLGDVRGWRFSSLDGTPAGRGAMEVREGRLWIEPPPEARRLSPGG